MSPIHRRTFSLRLALLCLVSVTSLTLPAPTLAAQAPSAAATSQPDSSGPDSSGPDTSRAAPAQTSSRELAVRPRFGGRWPGRRITYSERLSPSYDWAIKRAVRAWNRGSGARIKFVRAARGRRGDVLIKRAPTPSGGQATLGRHPSAWVHLSVGKRIERENWISISVLLAHELGHVLGINHLNSPTKQLLMEPYVPWHESNDDGNMSCRWVTKKDAKAAVRLYGGKVKLAPTVCQVEPPAPALLDVRASGGHDEGRPVTLSWGTPPGVPTGSTIGVQVNQAGDCGGSWFLRYHRVPLGATSWTDPDNRHETGAYCYTLRLTNYWGAGATPFVVTR